jgi:hypothetical protein
MLYSASKAKKRKKQRDQSKIGANVHLNWRFNGPQSSILLALEALYIYYVDIGVELSYSLVIIMKIYFAK